MIESIYINNFRLFKDFKIDKFGMVNLIVGKNNSGKSCLLEAIRVFGTNASPDVLFDIIRERGQDWEFPARPNQSQAVKELQNPLRCLFYGRRFPKMGADPIEIRPLKNGKNGLKVHLKAYRRIVTVNDRAVKQIEFARVEEESATGLDDAELVLDIENGERLNTIRLNRYPAFHSGMDYDERWSGNDAEHHVQMVPTKLIDIEDVAVLWDHVNIYPNLRKEVFEGLKLIDDHIQEVVLVGRKTLVQPVLICDNTDERIPLKSMGDGIIHFFHILLALVNSRGGVVLIDEFENGLHYSAQPGIWRFVFQLAQELEVQVFATTHSWDCVKAFQEATERTDAEGMLIHLGPSAKNGEHHKIIATGYDKNELRLASQADLEVR